MPKGESQRTAMGRHVITGKVGLCPVCCNIFPFHRVSVLPLNAPSLSPDSSASMSSVRSRSRLISALYWLCGMERRKEGDTDPVTPPAPEQPTCSLEEKPRLRTIVNVNLIICLSVTAFIIGYWAWQASYDILYGHVVKGENFVFKTHAKFHSFVAHFYCCDLFMEGMLTSNVVIKSPFILWTEKQTSLLNVFYPTLFKEL